MRVVALMYLNVPGQKDRGYVVGIMESSDAATVDEFIVDGEFLPVDELNPFNGSKNPLKRAIRGSLMENTHEIMYRSALRLGRVQNLPVMDLTTIECVHVNEVPK